MDPHRNIFYYYGRSRKNKEDIQCYDPQIENNTTKALINILEFTPGKIGLKAFFKAISLKPPIGSLEKPVSFSLQRFPEKVTNAKKRIIVTITSHTNESLIDEGSSGGIPDAWIYGGTGSWAVMIESKVRAKLSEKQITGHVKAVGWGKNYKRCDITWSDLYDHFSGALKQCKNNESKILLEQFLKYLEAIGMTKFNGFTSDDFDFFVDYDKDYRPIIRDKFRQFAEDVHKALPKKIKEQFPDIYQGNIKQTETGAWIAIRRKQVEGDPFKYLNFTVEIKKDCVLFNTVIRGGRVKESKRPIGVLYRKANNEFAKFKKILENLGEGFYIRVFRRTSHKGGSPRIGDEKWTQIADLSLETVTDTTIEHVLSLMENLSLSGLHIGTSFTRGSEIVKDKRKLISNGAKAIKKLESVFRFLLAD